ncbi:hypothetical protein BBP40_003418 [Aspergillus hancockii]|nr:hypothetical protein BBP40_003418 [Aspergillus hancockii]
MKKQIEEGDTRFSENEMYGDYHKLYVEDAPLNPQHGGGFGFGASSLEQVEDTLAFFKGPLSENVLVKIHALWKTVEHVVGVDNYLVVMGQ